MRAPEEGEFVWHEVSSRVNHVVNDDAQLTLRSRRRNAKPNNPGARRSRARARQPPPMSMTGRAVCSEKPI